MVSGIWPRTLHEALFEAVTRINKKNELLDGTQPCSRHVILFHRSRLRALDYEWHPFANLPQRLHDVLCLGSATLSLQQ